MSASRETILRRLRAAQGLEFEQRAEDRHLPMVPRKQESAAERLDRFVRQAEAIDCVVHRPRSESEAISKVVALVGDDSQVLSWDFDQIPLPGLEGALAARGVRVAAPAEASVRVGITGVDAALAATGSIVLESGKGKPRSASILPPLHIAVLRGVETVLPDLEAWMDQIRGSGTEKNHQPSSVLIITGPSRTADIAMEPVRGMHGPGQVHLVVLAEGSAEQLS